MVAPHCKELIERLPLCSTLEIHDAYIVNNHVAMRLDVCVLDGLRHLSVVLGVLCIISVLISGRVRNHVKPVRTDTSKQLFEEETLSHAALAEEKDILSPLAESMDKAGEPFLFVKLKSRQHQASCGRH